MVKVTANGISKVYEYTCIENKLGERRTRFSEEEIRAHLLERPTHGNWIKAWKPRN